MTKRSRLLVIAIAALAVIGVALPVVVERTSAAWTDDANFSAQSSAGTWAPITPTTPFRCVPVDPTIAAECTVVVTSWVTWDYGYDLGFSITTTSTKAFEWKLTMDLAATGYPATNGQTLFPGSPVPATATASAWTPNRFAMSNICVLSGQQTLPLIDVKSDLSWARNVSASSPVGGLDFQARTDGKPGPALKC